MALSVMSFVCLLVYATWPVICLCTSLCCKTPADWLYRQAAAIVAAQELAKENVGSAPLPAFPIFVYFAAIGCHMSRTLKAVYTHCTLGNSNPPHRLALYNV